MQIIERSSRLEHTAGFFEQAFYLAVSFVQPIVNHQFLHFWRVQVHILAPLCKREPEICPNMAPFLFMVDLVERDKHCRVLDIVHQSVDSRPEHNHVGGDGDIRREVWRNIHVPHFSRSP